MLNKRNCSSKVLFDEDDLILLKLIMDSGSSGIKQSELILKMGISHKGFLTHKRRLLDMWIIYENNLGEDYKTKYLCINMTEIKDAISLRNIFNITDKIKLNLEDKKNDK